MRLRKMSEELTPSIIVAENKEAIKIKQESKQRSV
jgi:hypothetical protein